MSENLRKKCVSCGFICFLTDETCKRCGAQELKEVPFKNKPPTPEPPDLTRRFPFVTYFICFLFALVIEFFALLPFLLNIGQRHSSGALVSDIEIYSKYALFFLHLPTILPVYLLNLAIPYDWMVFLYLITPFTQIIFLTWFLAWILRKFRF